jgi:homoserine O-acetyltransferase/O-succinyltransferase
MIQNNFYTAEVQGEHELYEIGDLLLEEGETLKNCKLAYRTFGTLNADRSNMILVTTWFSGTAKVMADVYVGTEHAIDPSKYFVVVVDQIGDGLSSSPHNTPSPQNMAYFPKIRIGDDVNAQHQLVTKKFDVKQLALVVGGSMGGQQVYEWAVRYPDLVQRAAAIAATAQNTFHDFMFTETLVEALTSDPAWKGGMYQKGEDVRDGLSRVAKLFAVMGWSTEFYVKKHWSTVLGMATERDFINDVMRAYFAPMDPNNLLSKAWKWQRGDVARLAGGDLKAALSRITAKVFTLPISHDMIFPPADCEAEQKMIPGGELRLIHSIEGHMALNGFEPNYMIQVDKHLKELLATDA